MSWKHFVTTKNWDSHVIKDYGIEGIPYVLLIDKQGEVITANGLTGNQLIATIKNHIGETVAIK